MNNKNTPLYRHGKLVGFNENVLYISSYGHGEKPKQCGDFKLTLFNYDHDKDNQDLIREMLGNKVKVTIEVVD